MSRFGSGEDYPQKAQLELGIARHPEPDRNHQYGGRSFYFFDLDDNVLHMPTQIYVFHKIHDVEKAMSTRQFAQMQHLIGKEGHLSEFELRTCKKKGSFRSFRDSTDTPHPSQQPFVEDLKEALKYPDYQWKGPSWECFYHAVFNQRPVSIITARGHHPDTIKEGIRLLVDRKILPCEPNYIDVLPVSYPPTQKQLGDKTQGWSTATLKRAAIMRSVEAAMELFGDNPYHRFGMSDDDPENIRLIIDAMKKLKQNYPENAFYVIDSHDEPFIKQEIFSDHVETTTLDTQEQHELFDI